MMKSRWYSLPVGLLLSAAVVLSADAQGVPEPVDEEAIATIREQGLEHSQVMDYLSWMTDVYGPRLTGSPMLDAATDWAARSMEEMGLVNVRKEAWGPFGSGWTLEHYNVEATTPQGIFPLTAYPKAWSPGTEGHVSGEVVIVRAETEEDLNQYRGKLGGKVVLMEDIREVDEWFDPLAKRRDDTALLNLANAPLPGERGGRRYSEEAMQRYRFQRQAASFVLSEKPAAILDRGSKGDYGTIFVSSARVPVAPDAGWRDGPSAYDIPAPETVPQFTVAVEHYNRLVRIAQKGLPVSVNLHLRVAFNEEDPMEYNVTGELAGTDPAIGDEVVILGGHYDSWHAGTGATDNATGSAVMMEAMRILKHVYAEKGNGPRRTIRIGLWTGEEQGLLGSRSYVQQHFAESEGLGQPPTALKPEHEKFSAYYNMDNGTGKIRGVYMQGNTEVEPIFRSWLQPFSDLGASTLSLQNTGGTDHLSFDAAGLPGFQFIQEPMAYSTRTHHSNMDVYDHAVADDLKQAATIIASFAYHTAERDDKLPRKQLKMAETASVGTQ
jgi:hypothetical protein